MCVNLDKIGQFLDFVIWTLENFYFYKCLTHSSSICPKGFASRAFPSQATDISINNRISRDLYRNRKFRRRRRVRLAMGIARCVESLTAAAGG